MSFIGILGYSFFLLPSVILLQKLVGLVAGFPSDGLSRYLTQSPNERLKALEAQHNMNLLSFYELVIAAVHSSGEVK